MTCFNMVKIIMIKTWNKILKFFFVLGDFIGDFVEKKKNVLLFIILFLGKNKKCFKRKDFEWFSKLFKFFDDF